MSNLKQQQPKQEQQNQTLPHPVPAEQKAPASAANSQYLKELTPAEVAAITQSLLLFSQLSYELFTQQQPEL